MLSLILLLTFILRLYKIDNPIADWHSWRQADTASVARIYFDEGINLLYPRYYDISTTQSKIFNPHGYRFVEFPIYNALVAILTKTGYFTLEIWGRLVSICSALVSLIFIYLLGKKYINYWGALLASFFYAVLPFNIYFTRVILPEPIATCFGLIGLWFGSEYLDKENNKLLLISTIFFALAILTKPFTIFYAVPLAYLAFKKYAAGVILQKKLLVAAILSVLPFLIWRIWISHFPEGIPLWKWVFNEDSIRFKPSFFNWIFGERLGILILGVWGTVPFAFGVLAYRKSKAFIHYFFLGMIAYFFIVATANVKHDYYQTIAVPSISLMLAYGAVTMWNLNGFRKQLTRALIFISILLMLLISAIKVREFYKINRPGILEAGLQVDKITPKDALVIAPYNGDTAFLYQTKRKGWPVVDRPIEELVDKGATYFVSVDLNDDQTIEFSKKYSVVEKTTKYIIIKLNDTNKSE